MKATFFWCLAIWLLGGALGQIEHISIIHEISVNIFGSLTIILGLVIAGRWAWRKSRGESGAPPAKPPSDGSDQY